MRQKILAIPCALLYFVLILLGCGKVAQEKVPEKHFEIIGTSQAAIQLPEQVVCDSEGAWCITTVKNDFIYEISASDAVMKTQEIEWQPSGKEYDLINIAEKNGILYAQIHNREENTLEIYKHSTNGCWNAVMSIRPDDMDKYTIVGVGFYVDSSENVYLISENALTCFSDQGLERFRCELNGNVIFLQENSEGNMECLDTQQNRLTLYQLNDNKPREQWTIHLTDSRIRGIATDDKASLCLATDTEILFVDKASGNVTAAASLVKSGVASVLAGYYHAEDETLQLYSSAGSNEIHYTLLSEKDTAEEERTELVYGVMEAINSDPSSSIRKAIHAFNQENENYYITIKNYDRNLDRLHADMAAGNGPDIIDMANCEYYESYVKNGYLEDLLPYLERSQYKNDMIWNVLNTYKVNGGLYLMVPQFQVECLVIHPDYADSIEKWDMKTFSAIIEENAWEKDSRKNLLTGSKRPPPSIRRSLWRSSPYVENMRIWIAPTERP